MIEEYDNNLIVRQQNKTKERFLYVLLPIVLILLGLGFANPHHEITLWVCALVVMLISVIIIFSLKEDEEELPSEVDDRVQTEVSE